MKMTPTASSGLTCNVSASAKLIILTSHVTIHPKANLGHMWFNPAKFGALSAAIQEQCSSCSSV